MREKTLALGAFAAVAFGAFVAAADGPATPSKLQRVVSIWDGDTIRTIESGAVRLAGFDAPELGKGGARCPEEDRLAREARDHLASLIRARGVRLERARDDRGRLQPDADRYNRLLRAAYTADDADIAADMIAKGYAVPYWGKGTRKDWCAVLRAIPPPPPAPSTP